MGMTLYRVISAGLHMLAVCALGAAGGAMADESDVVASALTEQEMKRGRILFLQCSACHSLTRGDSGGKIGPSLANVFGRKAGSAEHFGGYSSALTTAGHMWDRDTMNRWLTSPADMVPGTSMVFAGIHDEVKRDLLVRYLERVTASIPE